MGCPLFILPDRQSVRSRSLTFTIPPAVSHRHLDTLQTAA